MVELWGNAIRTSHRGERGKDPSSSFPRTLDAECPALASRSRPRAPGEAGQRAGYPLQP